LSTWNRGFADSFFVSSSGVSALLGVAAVLLGDADEFGDLWVDLDLGILSLR
jgi:hypothetical protein